MSGIKVGRNELCPCGTGKKYKNCCINKDFDWMEDENGVYKSMPLSKEMADLLKDHMAEKEKRIGRKINPDDKIFDFDPVKMQKHMMEQMFNAGIPENFIYAYMKTGMLVTKQNENKWSESDLEEWDEALDEYDFLNDHNMLDNLSVDEIMEVIK